MRHQQLQPHLRAGKAWDLPESTSINKQITYGEYVANEEKFKKRVKDIIYHRNIVIEDKENEY